MRPASKLKVRLVQLNPRLGDVEANVDLHMEAIKQAIADDVSLIIFPELSLTGYYLRDLAPEVAMRVEGPVMSQLARLSKEIGIVVGFVEEDEQFSFFIAQAYLEGGAVRHVHRKVYLPTYGMFDEGRYFTAGRRLRTLRSKWGPMGILICEDLWHPSAPYVLSQSGMYYLIACASSPGRGIHDQHIATAGTYANILTTYAQLFQVYVLFCNRVGYEEGVCFWGGSCVIGPQGVSVAAAPQLEPAVLDAELDVAAIRRVRLQAPLTDDENLDLTIRELERVRRERAED